MGINKKFFFIGLAAFLLVSHDQVIPCRAAVQPTDSLAFGAYTDFRSSVKEFQELHGLIRLTLSRNKTTFLGKTGTVSGFAAGTAYPQIWLRDANTIIPASRYYYEIPFLQSWLEEHLAFQKKDGSLEDWIDSRGKSDKNTTETDQETSAARAALQIMQTAGPSWFEKKIRGEAVLSRLEKALLFVLRLRFDKVHGLITGAHTADWGDVDIENPDQNAIYVDKKTHWTCDIYDQSQFFGAAQDMAKMMTALGQEERAKFWKEQARLIQNHADQWLWQNDRGFYRVHIHLDSLRHAFDEDAMFAMGGNAEAVLSGLASEDKCRRIFEVALARQKELSISTISGSLLPPYPKGVFKHPMMDDPFEYQNGGQWDWFGGKLVYAMFERGFSRIAREKLLEIAKKNAANRGLYEWDSPDGRGRGSAFFSGSAGSLAKALMEGYFGIKIAHTSLSLEPKLGEDRAVVHVYIPASGLFAAYDYQWDPAKKTVSFRYNSNIRNPGTVKILIPWIREGNASSENLKNVEVRKDGAKIAFQHAVLNDDSFIIVETDFQDHILEIKLVRTP